MSSRRRGRPSLEPGEPSTIVSVRLPVPLHEAALQSAGEQRLDLATFIRRAVEREVGARRPHAGTVIRSGPV